MIHFTSYPFFSLTSSRTHSLTQHYPFLNSTITIISLYLFLLVQSNCDHTCFHTGIIFIKMYVEAVNVFNTLLFVIFRYCDFVLLSDILNCWWWLLYLSSIGNTEIWLWGSYSVLGNNKHYNLPHPKTSSPFQKIINSLASFQSSPLQSLLHMSLAHIW